MGLIGPNDPNRPELKARVVQRAPIFVGREEEFVPSSTFYQLVGERCDIWHHLSRPADEIAQSYLQDNYGYYVARVMRRPDWVFTEPPRDKELDPHSRLIDGLLCGCLIEYDWWWHELDWPRGDEQINYVAVTPAGFTKLHYLRRAGERVANLILQHPMESADWYPNMLQYFKAHCPHWRVFLEE